MLHRRLRVDVACLDSAATIAISQRIREEQGQVDAPTWSNT